MLTGGKFMPEFHLRQPGLTYSACGLVTKHRERIQKFRGTGDLNDIYKNELDKFCFAHDAAYSDSKDFARKTVSDKILKDKAYEVAINPKHDGCQRGLAGMMYKFLDKKTGWRATVNEEPAQESHKPVIKKFKRRKVYPRFKDKIWAIDFAKIESLSSKN